MIERHLADSAATDALGHALAACRPANAVVHLHGDLGAGKSTLARALLRALGVAGTIRSPTYTLVERYPLADGREAWHMDLYRIGDPGELDFLGLDEGAASLCWWSGPNAGPAPCRRWTWPFRWPSRGRAARCRCRPARPWASSGWPVWRPDRHRLRRGSSPVTASLRPRWRIYKEKALLFHQGR